MDILTHILLPSTITYKPLTVTDEESLENLFSDLIYAFDSGLRLTVTVTTTTPEARKRQLRCRDCGRIGHASKRYGGCARHRKDQQQPRSDQSTPRCKPVLTTTASKAPPVVNTPKTVWVSPKIGYVKMTPVHMRRNPGLLPRRHRTFPELPSRSPTPPAVEAAGGPPAPKAPPPAKANPKPLPPTTTTGPVQWRKKPTGPPPGCPPEDNTTTDQDQEKKNSTTGPVQGRKKPTGPPPKCPPEDNTATGQDQEKKNYRPPPKTSGGTVVSSQTYPSEDEDGSSRETIPPDNTGGWREDKRSKRGRGRPNK